MNFLELPTVVVKTVGGKTNYEVENFNDYKARTQHFSKFIFYQNVFFLFS